MKRQVLETNDVTKKRAEDGFFGDDFDLKSVFLLYAQIYVEICGNERRKEHVENQELCKSRKSGTGI